MQVGLSLNEVHEAKGPRLLEPGEDARANLAEPASERCNKDWSP